MRHLLTLVLLSSCVDSSRPAWLDVDASSGLDASVPVDASADLGLDAGQDTGVDIGADAGPACECSAGACCDGCHLRPANFQCSTRIDGPDTQAGCTQFTTNVCGGAGYARITFSRWDRFCSGYSVACDGAIASGELARTVTCDSDGATPWASQCVVDQTALGAHCEACP